MDTSEAYIKQCDKAEEIQRMNVAHPLIPNIFCIYGSYFSCPGIGYQDISRQECNKVTEYRGIWLPRQDQLQAMINIPEDKSYKVLRLAHRFWFFINKCPQISTAKRIPRWAKNIAEFTSMEQLWLAFVMKTLYSKVWNSEEWVKDGIKECLKETQKS